MIVGIEKAIALREAAGRVDICWKESQKGGRRGVRSKDREPKVPSGNIPASVTVHRREETNAKRY